jgi:TIR domain/Protein of unknown function (DUF2510)
MTIFISYARKDRTTAEALRHDLERARSSVWLDDELTGGQAWWETILGQIRSCELFVFALSPDSLRSKACQAELRYALDLKRPLLPVMVRAVSIQLAPAAIADTQIIDYTERTADSAVALITAAANRPPAPALPQPLPVPPPPPMSYMNPYREQIQSSDLSFRDQAQIVLALRGHLQDEDERDTARELLVDLRRRQDIAESVARDVDELLASVPAAEPRSSAGATPTWTSPTTDAKPDPEPATTPVEPAAAAASWYPDPTGRYEQRYWDGSRWTDHVSTGGQPTVDAVDGTPKTAGDTTKAAGPTRQTSTAAPSASTPGAPFSGGAYAALIVATLFVGIVGVIVGAINLKHPGRRGQAQLLLWLGIASMIVGYLLVS